MINKISFKNYKSFKDLQTIEFSPVTVIIGKNSSGKSAVAKLPVMIDNSFNNVMGEPYALEYNDVQFGGDYRDMFYGRIPNAELEFILYSDDDKQLTIKIISDFEKNTIPIILQYKLAGVFDFHFTPKNNLYLNQLDGLYYDCDFDGFFLADVFKEDGSEASFEISNRSFDNGTDYIGPFRSYANSMRSFQIRSYKQTSAVGPDGEAAYYILGVESLSNNSDLIKKVSEWYKINFDGWGITVNNDLQPHCTIELTREDKKFNVNIADVGQGMSQALPLVVKAFLPPKAGELIIIEQPELHLHPAAHGNLAELFASTAVSENKRYLIETHSQNFVLRLRRMIAEQKLKNTDVGIYWVDYDGSNNKSILKKININTLGDVDFWPPNIFSESLDEAIAIRTAQRNREEDVN